MSTSVESIAETMILLMKSTGRYVHHRIDSKPMKLIYAKTLNRCIAAVRANQSDYESFEHAIFDIRCDIDSSLRPRFFNKLKHEREYYRMACDQALEIVHKLHGRYITGMSDSEPRNYKNKGFLIPKDEGIFDEDLSSTT